MKGQTITQRQLAAFARQLRQEERGEGTVENYLRHVGAFARWLGGRPLEKELAAAWKESLVSRGYRPGTVNTMVVSLNRFLDFAGLPGCKVKTLRVQRRVFREEDRELTREEYRRLLGAARASGRGRLALLMETICSTGIRVSEVRYITVEALRSGRMEISLKGKIRTVMFPRKLRQKLWGYCKKKKAASGQVFLTRNGASLSRKQIWAEMKSLCALARVAPSKVFPHNLRHLFARAFYKACRDVVRLADVLGHSSIETTRIYLLSTGAEHARTLELLRLVS